MWVQQGDLPEVFAGREVPEHKLLLTLLPRDLHSARTNQIDGISFIPLLDDHLALFE